jgi:hypothetical protein
MAEDHVARRRRRTGLAMPGASQGISELFHNDAASIDRADDFAGYRRAQGSCAGNLEKRPKGPPKTVKASKLNLSGPKAVQSVTNLD